MNNKILINKGIKKIGIALVSQALILLCSFVLSLVMPKYMNKEMYGYWQIYYFYLNYINFITFGYNDGLVLKYGGMEKENIPIERIRSGNCIIFLFSVAFTLFGFIAVNLADLSDEYTFIYSVLLISMPCVCMFNVITSIFLATNRQEKYNLFNLLNRCLMTIGCCGFLFLGVKNYESMIWIDCIARVLVTVAVSITGLYFLKGRRATLQEGLQETKENCFAGIFVTMGALLAALVPVSGRVVLEKNASIAEYASYSFAMSVLALVVTFTSAIGMVFFPMLKNLTKEKMLDYYNKIEKTYLFVICLALGAYIPAVLIVKYFLTDYIDVLNYLYLIFALCVPLGKLQMVVTPYMKAFRMEKKYFAMNLAGVLCIFSGCEIVYSVTESVNSVAMVTLLLFMAWDVVVEFCVKRQLKVGEISNILGEALIVIGFVLIAALKNMSVFVIAYSVVIIILLMMWIRRRKNGF